MNKRHFILSLGSLPLLSACVPSGTINSQTEQPKIPQGKALIVFYRPAAFAGGAIRFNINHAEGPVGQLISGSVLYKTVSPGAQTFWSQVISQDAITINATAGQTYYVRGDVKMGLYAGRPSFTQVSEAQALQELK